MAERHIHEDYVSCDWCGKEESGTRCSQYTDIERIIIGNVRTHFNRNHFSSYPSLLFTGLETDLCKSCEMSFYEHVMSFIKANSVKDKRVSAD